MGEYNTWPISNSNNGIGWACAVTTVPSRFDTYLPETLESLNDAGFPSPHLFIDGFSGELPEQLRRYEHTCRSHPAKVVGNWLLTIWELYIKHPKADRFVIFQDDIIACRNLRQFLERSPYPEDGYLNLHTFPANEKIAQRKGWYHSNQRGLSATGLCFNLEAVIKLLSSRHTLSKPRSVKRGTIAVDGYIVTAFKEFKWKEYVHNPSLIQHLGDNSTIADRKFDRSKTFPGRDFDALKLL